MFMAEAEPVESYGPLTLVTILRCCAGTTGVAGWGQRSRIYSVSLMRCPQWMTGEEASQEPELVDQKSSKA